MQFCAQVPMLLAVILMQAQAVLGAPDAEVAPLNRVTFTQNVLASREGAGPENWVVLFCVDWYQPCWSLKEHFLELAGEHGGLSDDELFSRKTRFAEVDCTVDKVLCNTQDVDSYPTVVHYRGGGRLGEWSSNGKGVDKDNEAFTKWLGKQIQRESPTVVETTEDAGRTWQHPRSVTVAQLGWMVVALGAAAIWFSKNGLELWQGLQHVRAATSGQLWKQAGAASAEGCDWQQKSAPLVVAAAAAKEASTTATAPPALLRALSEGWAKERTSLEI